MAGERGGLTFRDLALAVLARAGEPIRIDPHRKNLHAAFHAGLSSNAELLNGLLTERVMFNRWRGGPASEHLDDALDDLLFFELARESKDSLEISERGRKFLQEELSELEGSARSLLDEVAHAILEKARGESKREKA